VRFAIVAVALAAALAAAGTGGGAASSGGGGVAPLAVVGPHLAGVAGQPPTSAQCQAAFGIACYGPPDLRAQYQFGPAYAAGDTGKGQTIVIFDSFGSPTIAQDLATFDAAYNIPAPPSFTVRARGERRLRLLERLGRGRRGEQEPADRDQLG
jgi:hypothetical protein